MQKKINLHFGYLHPSYNPQTESNSSTHMTHLYIYNFFDREEIVLLKIKKSKLLYVQKECTMRRENYIKEEENE